ncbi:MAG: hypothetical protein HYT75_04400 [Deltaproteobacteria bacterium]|nr:hypothetical protein [Deltaproteobacteria bacterium]MBI2341332.1 hypothetical protein [Deltaproteobacteria bacterium]
MAESSSQVKELKACPSNVLEDLSYTPIDGVEVKAAGGITLKAPPELVPQLELPQNIADAFCEAPTDWFKAVSSGHLKDKGPRYYIKSYAKDDFERYIEKNGGELIKRISQKIFQSSYPITTMDSDFGVTEDDLKAYFPPREAALTETLKPERGIFHSILDDLFKLEIHYQLIPLPMAEKTIRHIQAVIKDSRNEAFVKAGKNNYAVRMDIDTLRAIATNLQIVENNMMTDARPQQLILQLDSLRTIFAGSLEKEAARKEQLKGYIYIGGTFGLVTTAFAFFGIKAPLALIGKLWKAWKNRNDKNNNNPPPSPPPVVEERGTVVHHSNPYQFARSPRPWIDDVPLEPVYPEFWAIGFGYGSAAISGVKGAANITIDWLASRIPQAASAAAAVTMSTLLYLGDIIEATDNEK